MAPAALRRSVPWLTHTPLHDDDARDEDVSHAAFEARRHYEAVGSADAEMPAVHRGMAALMDAAREWRARLEHLRLLQVLVPDDRGVEIDALQLNCVLLSPCGADEYSAHLLRIMAAVDAELHDGRVPPSVEVTHAQQGLFDASIELRIGWSHAKALLAKVAPYVSLKPAESTFAPLSVAVLVGPPRTTQPSVLADGSMPTDMVNSLLSRLTYLESTRLEARCFTLGASQMHAAAERHCRAVTHLGHTSFLEAARLINAASPMVLVELSATPSSRSFEIAALRPCAIQVSVCTTFRGSSGAPFIDYVVTDAVSSPPEASSVYIEKFAFLQSTLAALPTPTAIAHAVSQRSSTDSVRVCAADGVGQLSPPRLAELSRLTRAARAGNPAAQLVLVVDRGVVGEGWAPALDEEFVISESSSDCDMMLDNSVFNLVSGGTEHIGRGIALVTASSDIRLCGRTTASMLRAAGLSVLIARNAADLEDLVRCASAAVPWLKSIVLAAAKRPFRFQRDLERQFAMMLDIQLSALGTRPPVEPGKLGPGEGIADHYPHNIILAQL